MNNNMNIFRFPPAYICRKKGASGPTNIVAYYYWHSHQQCCGLGWPPI